MVVVSTLSLTSHGVHVEGRIFSIFLLFKILKIYFIVKGPKGCKKVIPKSIYVS